MLTATIFLCLLGVFILAMALDRRRGTGATWYRRDNLWELEPRTTPLSEALGKLIGNAGGIYLSIVLLLTFLGVEPPARMVFAGLDLEPLASAAIVLAALQTGTLYFYSSIKRRRVRL